jgi:hypothetical protein
MDDLDGFLRDRPEICWGREDSDWSEEMTVGRDRSSRLESA